MTRPGPIKKPVAASVLPEAWPAAEVEVRPVASLSPYSGNPRIHSAEQVEKIAASIREFGWTMPVLVDEVGEVIAGHGRLMAAAHLGISVVPCLVARGWSEAKRRAYRIADNRLTELSVWDQPALFAELQAIRGDGFELELTGFTELDFDGLLELIGDDLAPASPGDPDFVPAPPPDPVSCPGDLWILGEHRVICGDSTRPADLQRLCGGALVEAMWTDPPYGVACVGKAGSIANDDLAPAAFARFLRDAFSAAFSVIAPGGAVYVAHADTEGLAFRRAFAEAGFKLSGCLVWVKPSLVLGRSDYQWRHEPIPYGWKPGAAHRWYGGRAKTTVSDQQGAPVRFLADGSVQVDVGGQVFSITGSGLAIEPLESSVLRCEKPARSAVHPTMKPVALILEGLENSTRRGDVILDPFGGSGSTLIACASAGRSARLCELDPLFVDVIVDRWETFTGRKAVLDGSGQEFRQVAEDRGADR